MNEQKKYRLKEEGHKENPFKVPEGYFDTLSDRVMDRINREEPEKKVRIRQIIRPQLALAAAILGFALISYTFVRVFTPGSTTGEYYDLATLEKISYFYDESTLMEMIPSEDGTESEEDLWVDDAIDYLADNEIGFYQLIDDYGNY